MNEKEQRLAEFCREGGYDGVLLRRRSNVAWLTDGADTHIDSASALGIAALLWTPGRKAIFTDNIEAPRLRAEEPLAGWEVVESPWWTGGGEEAQAAALAWGDFATDWPEDAIGPLRWSLTPTERERARSLGRDTAEVVERLLKEDAKPGMTEWHLGGAVAGWLRDRGILGHVILVAADERISRFRHPIPTRKPIERTAMVAVCGQRHGLIVSATRLVHFGRISDDLRRRHEAVCGVDAALHKATQPGARWCDALGAGVRVYEQTGFGEEWRLHHQGGPMGYECRDFKATPTEEREVQAHQLVGWNPSITGTKSEDTILVGGSDGATERRSDAARGGGYEVITHTGGWPIGLQGRPAILER